MLNCPFSIINYLAERFLPITCDSIGDALWAIGDFNASFEDDLSQAP
jgi:hypothetical protein